MALIYTLIRITNIKIVIIFVEIIIGRIFFFFKQKTAYEVRISDWGSDVCSSDLGQGFVEAFRFSGEDVKCCARQMPRSQCRMQRIDIDHCAARCVDKYGARLHGCNGLRVDDVLGGLAARYVQSNNIGLRQQFLQRSTGPRIAQRQLSLDVVENNTHAGGFCQGADLRTDVAVADNSQRLAARLEGAFGGLVPMTLMHPVVLLWKDRKRTRLNSSH